MIMHDLYERLLRTDGQRRGSTRTAVVFILFYLCYSSCAVMGISLIGTRDGVAVI